jgi:hypothetical protein
MKQLPRLLLPLLLIAACGCAAHRAVSSADPVKNGVIPPECRVVAQTSSADDPLLFIPNGDGAVYYVAKDDLLATFAVRAGERIELNGGDRANSYATEIRVDGKSVFNSKSRAGRHRFYFWRKA